MRDDDSLRNEQKRQATNTSGIGKSLLNRLKSPNSPVADKPTDKKDSLDRRTYMRLAGSAAAAATMGTAASATAAADSHSSGERIDVTAEPYGAVGDGSSDDTAAIQSAIDDASSGDTVYFPAGTYAVSGSETILEIHGNSHPDDLTLAGDGPDSVIKYTGGNGGGNYFMLRVRGGLGAFECHDLVLDGGYESVSGDPTAGLTLNQLGEYSGQSYHFENCVIRGGYNQGANVNGHGVSFVNCTVRENGGHGITFGPDTLVEDSRLLVDNCLVEDNTFLHGGHYALDTARGNFLVRDTVIQNNGESATKIAGAGIDTDGKHLRVRIDNNGYHPFQAAPGYDNQAMTFEDVVVSNNGSYWRLNDPVDYSFNGEIVATNNGYDGTHSSVHLFSSATLDGSGATLWSNNNDGTGFNSDADTGGNYIEQYNYYNNAGGAVGSTDNISFGTTSESEKTDLDVVPTASEVGAWATSSSDSGGSEEEEDDSGTTSSVSGVSHLATAGGVIQTSGGVITTASSGPAPSDAVEDFESYATGTALSSTAPWTGAGPYPTNYEVTDAAAATGGQSVVLTDSSNYNAIQSMPGDGLGTYPSADCTLRMASYIDGGTMDIGFGVPDDETNYDYNCYRLMGGPGTSGTPRLTRTIDYDMETLASLDNSFPTGTWLDHVIEFESTGSEVVITYTGYAWDTANSEWTQFESATQAVDSSATFADGSGLGIGGFRAGTNGLRHDNLRIEAAGDNGSPTWTPVTENP